MLLWCVGTAVKLPCSLERISIATQYILNSQFVKCVRCATSAEIKTDTNVSGCGLNPKKTVHAFYVIVIGVFACDCDVNQMKVDNVTPCV